MKIEQLQDILEKFEYTQEFKFSREVVEGFLAQFNKLQINVDKLELQSKELQDEIDCQKSSVKKMRVSRNESSNEADFFRNKHSDALVLLNELRPYVDHAYECAFPDHENNMSNLERIDTFIKPVVEPIRCPFCALSPKISDIQNNGPQVYVHHCKPMNKTITVIDGEPENE